MTLDLLQFALVLAVMSGLAVVLGRWIARLFTSDRHALLERATYRLLGEEMNSPRGRIFLMKEALEGGLALEETTLADVALGALPVHVDRLARDYLTQEDRRGRRSG